MSRKSKEFDSESRTFFHPANDLQRELIYSINNNSVTVVSGCAGTGKTALSIQTLYQLYKQAKIDQILIIRLVTETFGEKLGALPGDLGEKLLYCLGPIIDNLSQIIPAGELECLISQKRIEVIPISHCRGRSFYRKGVIIEEAQNLTTEMIITVLTRIAKESKLVFNGDPYQVDILDGRNGIAILNHILDDLEDCGIIQFKPHHVKRHELIPRILNRVEDLKRRSIL
jgi:phosphate starvation-inducible PhoH-like protein